jgi:hypothetical protein
VGRLWAEVPKHLECRGIIGVNSESALQDLHRLLGLIQLDKGLRQVGEVETVLWL